MHVSPRRLLLFLIVMLSPLVAAPAYAKKHDTGFLDRTITVQGITYKYQVFVPDNWNSHQKWPVIFFFTAPANVATMACSKRTLVSDRPFATGAPEFPPSW